MSILSKKTFSIFLISVLFVVFAIIQFDIISESETRIIDGDGSGLYAYLPQILLHHSVDFSQIFEIEKQQRSLDFTGHYFHEVNGITINKFSCGTALLELPFFLLALLLSLLFGFPADGYSLLFQLGIAFAALFWALVGMLYFVKLSKTYGVSENKAFLAMMVGFFGINMFYYTLFAPSSSHVYSFSMISIFAYYARKTFIQFENTTLYFTAFLFGLIVLIRPVNIIIIAAVPFLAGIPENFLSVLKKKLQPKIVVVSFLFFVLAISPQLIINYLQTGQLLFYGYKNEGFIFSNPEIINFLFSYRKGWFLYTPLMLLVFPAGIFLWKKSVFQFWTFLFFFFIVVYVFSSWWNWIYGDSFGMRPMIDFYSIFLLVILLFFHNLKNKNLQTVLLLFAGLAIFFNLFQTYQYRKGIIHPDSMNKAAYWYVFLKTGEEYENAVSEQYEYYYGELASEAFFESKNTIDEVAAGWSDAFLSAEINESSNKSSELNKEVIYSPSFTFIFPPDLIGKQNIYVIFSADYFEPYGNAASKAMFVADISNTVGETVFYKSFRVKKLPDKNIREWKKAEIGFKLPEISADYKQLKLYIWNIDQQLFFVDNLRVRFYTYEN